MSSWAYTRVALHLSPKKVTRDHPCKGYALPIDLQSGALRLDLSDSYRRIATTIGVLYIIGTVAGVLSVVAATPVLNAPDELARNAVAGSQLLIGALLVLTMGLALALIPVVLYPLARKYNSRLIPRWLSVWGLVAIIMHLSTVFVILFTRTDPMAPALLILNVPIFVQEMVLALWLIVRGFSTAAIAAEAVEPGHSLQSAHGRVGN